MKIRTLLTICISGGMLVTAIAFADHNSPMGAGFASMPNDIHNSRLEDSDEEFMDLVRYGDGVDSVNRYDDETTTLEPREAMTSTRSGAIQGSMGSSRSTSRTTTTMGRGTSRR